MIRLCKTSIDYFEYYGQYKVIDLTNYAADKNAQHLRYQRKNKNVWEHRDGNIAISI